MFRHRSQKHGLWHTLEKKWHQAENVLYSASTRGSFIPWSSRLCREMSLQSWGLNRVCNWEWWKKVEALESHVEADLLQQYDVIYYQYISPGEPCWGRPTPAIWCFRRTGVSRRGPSHPCERRCWTSHTSAAKGAGGTTGKSQSRNR